jgi:hypothetical protein
MQPTKTIFILWGIFLVLGIIAFSYNIQHTRIQLKKIKEQNNINP